MKQFLNTLEDSMCILDINKKLMYLNKASQESIGYVNKLIDMQILEYKIVFDKEQIHLYIKNSEGKWKSGRLQTYEITIEEEQCFLGKIQWSDILDKKKKAQLLEAFLENLNQSVCIKDKLGNYIYANRHYRERINATEDEIMGKRDENYWGEQYSTFFKESDDYTLETNMECVIEEKVVEEEKYFETTKFPIVHEDTYIGVLIKDITLQKILYSQLVRDQSENNKLSKLHHTVKSLKEYFKTNQVNIWLYNQEKECITPCFNIERIQKAFGGRIDLPLLKHQAERIKNGGEVVVRSNTFPFRRNNIRLDQTKPIFYTLYYPIVYENKLLGLLNIILDKEPKQFVVKNYYMNSICQHIAIILATQYLSNQLQKECEQRINVEDDLRKIVSIVTDLIIVVDTQGYFTWGNEGCMQILGWSEEEFLNMKWQDIIHPDDYENAKIKQKKWIQYGRQEPCINRYRCSDGTYKWLRWDGYYKKTNGMFIAAAKDITYEIELEMKEKLAKEVLQIEKVRNEFFANLSHEFKTPLTLIMSALQMLEGFMNDSLENQSLTTKYVGIMRQNSYRLLRLVNNLIDVTKIDAGYYEVTMHNYNIINVVEEIVMSVAEYAKNQEIEIIFDTEVEEEVIACDPEKIERIILNLLSNALKYTLEEGKIQVSMEVEGKEVLIIVQDNGIGIPSEKVPYIFERFMQVNDVLTRHCEGSGIGLSLVKSLVELHEGTIDVESSLGEGTRFEIRLPRIQKAEEELLIENIDDCQMSQRRIEKCHIEFSDIYKI
ncbi:ATP-binding protein [Niameybacter massiliensis]|uniref:ATP-binding protein n=1 Tax=Niameybacter massiliensis TaxID=1658108 RepID=UPI0006B3FC31|nr:ATP-binding protein [Niameybacter massiliensis]